MGGASSSLRSGGSKCVGSGGFASSSGSGKAWWALAFPLLVPVPDLVGSAVFFFGAIVVATASCGCHVVTVPFFLGRARQVLPFCYTM